MSLAPLLTMAVSDRLVPVGKQRGMEVGGGVGLRLVEANSQYETVGKFILEEARKAALEGQRDSEPRQVE